MHHCHCPFALRSLCLLMREGKGWDEGRHVHTKEALQSWVEHTHTNTQRKKKKKKTERKCSESSIVVTVGEEKQQDGVGSRPKARCEGGGGGRRRSDAKCVRLREEEEEEVPRRQRRRFAGRPCPQRMPSRVPPFSLSLSLFPRRPLPLPISHRPSLSPSEAFTQRRCPCARRFA